MTRSRLLQWGRILIALSILCFLIKHLCSLTTLCGNGYLRFRMEYRIPQRYHTERLRGSGRNLKSTADKRAAACNGNARRFACTFVDIDC